MSKYLDKAVELRAIVTPHYNCAQSVVLPFAKDAGLSEEMAYKFAGAFGGGMKSGRTCGAMTGGLMVLGLFGMDDPQTVGKYWRMVTEKHDNMTECKDLLRVNAQAGKEKKPHCDAMVYECLNAAETILKEAGKL